VALLVLTGGAGGCVSPAIDDSGYVGKVVHSAESMLGIVGTVRLAGRLDLRGRLTEAVRDTVISDAENDSESVLTSLDGVQPPDSPMIALRKKADSLLQRTAGDVADLRIATRAGDRTAARQALQSLGQDSADLQRLKNRT